MEFMAGAKEAERKRATLRRRKESTCTVESAPSASLKKFIASEEREYLQHREPQRDIVLGIAMSICARDRPESIFPPHEGLEVDWQAWAGGSEVEAGVSRL